MKQPIEFFLYKKKNRVFGIGLEAVTGTKEETFCKSFLLEIKQDKAEFNFKPDRIYLKNSSEKTFEFFISKSEAQDLREFLEADIPIKIKTLIQPKFQIIIILRDFLIRNATVSTELKKVSLKLAYKN